MLSKGFLLTCQTPSFKARVSRPNIRSCLCHGLAWNSNGMNLGATRDLQHKNKSRTWLATACLSQSGCTTIKTKYPILFYQALSKLLVCSTHALPAQGMGQTYVIYLHEISARVSLFRIWLTHRAKMGNKIFCLWPLPSLHLHLGTVSQPL